MMHIGIIEIHDSVTIESDSGNKIQIGAKDGEFQITYREKTYRTKGDQLRPTQKFVIGKWYTEQETGRMWRCEGYNSKSNLWEFTMGGTINQTYLYLNDLNSDIFKLALPESLKPGK